MKDDNNFMAIKAILVCIFILFCMSGYYNIEHSLDVLAKRKAVSFETFSEDIEYRLKKLERSHDGHRSMCIGEFGRTLDKINDLKKQIGTK